MLSPDSLDESYRTFLNFLKHFSEHVDNAGLNALQHTILHQKPLISQHPDLVHIVFSTLLKYALQSSLVVDEGDKFSEDFINTMVLYYLAYSCSEQSNFVFSLIHSIEYLITNQGNKTIIPNISNDEAKMKIDSVVRAQIFFLQLLYSILKVIPFYSLKIYDLFALIFESQNESIYVLGIQCLSSIYPISVQESFLMFKNCYFFCFKTFPISITNK